MASKTTVAEILNLFQEEFGANRVKITDTRVKLWHHMLEEFEDQTVKAAVYDIISSYEREFPPQISLVRSRCVDLSKGVLREIGPAEAWLRVNMEGVDLLPAEKTALKGVGGRWHLKNTAQPERDRTYFMQLYREIKTKEQKEFKTMTRVKQFADAKAQKNKLLEQPKQAPVEQPEPIEEITQERIDDLVSTIKWED